MLNYQQLNLDIFLIKLKRFQEEIPPYLKQLVADVYDRDRVKIEKIIGKDTYSYEFYFYNQNNEKESTEFKINYTTNGISFVSNCKEFASKGFSRWYAFAIYKLIEEIASEVLQPNEIETKIIQKNVKITGLKKTLAVRQTNTPIQISIDTTTEKIYDLKSNNDLMVMLHDSVISNLNQMEINVYEFKRLRSYFNQDNTQKVSINYISTNTISVNCTCNEQVKGLCKHEKQVIYELKKYIDGGAFFKLFCNNFEEKHEQLKNQFNLKDHQVKKYIGVTFFDEYNYDYFLHNTLTSNPKEKLPTISLPLGSLKTKESEQKILSLLNKSTQNLTQEIVLFAKENNNYSSYLFTAIAEYKKNQKDFKQNIKISGYIEGSKHAQALAYFSKKNSIYLHNNPEEIYTKFDQYQKAIQHLAHTDVFFSRQTLYQHSFNSTQVKLTELVPLKINTTAYAEILLLVSKTEDLLTANYVLRIFTNGEEKIIPPKENDINRIELSIGIHYAAEVYPWKKAFDIANSHLIFEKEVACLIDQEASFIQDYLIPISKNIPIVINDNAIKITPNPTTMQLNKRIYLKALDNHVLFTPMLAYDDFEIELFTTEDFFVQKENSVIKIKRDTKTESQFTSFIKELHPKFDKSTLLSFLHLSPDEMIHNYWFLSFFEKCKQQAIEIFGFDTLSNFKYNPNKPRLSSSIKSGINWFDVELDVNFGGQKIMLSELKKMLQKNEKFIRLGDGSLGLLPQEWIEKLHRYFRYGEIKKDTLKISKLKFNLIEDLFEELQHTKGLIEINAKKQKLLNYAQQKDIPLPKKLNADLRPYQEAAYQWFYFLQETNLGGCLADDMGLGKTLQVITLLLKEKELKKKASLVVLPKSLLFNWAAEIEKFAPQLRYIIHHGTQRIQEDKKFEEYDVVLTTYGTLASDIELFNRFKFNYAVLDESQAIKNPQSIRFKSVCLIQSEHRLALTGTPIENNTFDLYAQMHFLNPGLLGNLTTFKKHYSDPIDINGSKEIAVELQKLIHPFLLRRTKKQVAKELPEKTESVIYCEMEPDQYDFYTKASMAYKASIEEMIDQDGLGKSKMLVIEALTKLRQICNAPVLVDAASKSSSVKIAVLRQHILEKTGKHKVLVFSQFVGMLKLIQADLKQHGVKTIYLDGSTNNRGDLVEEFQTNNEISVFLISLKAGGTGLNLTAADYVYLVDPWWNPAVENQAIDRCYRIGQDKHVFAYRMICKNTIEEKIQQLQAKKIDLAEDLIKTDEGFMKKLQKEDLKSLFA